jgi:hypothetical protein
MTLDADEFKIAAGTGALTQPARRNRQSEGKKPSGRVGVHAS